MKEELDKFRNKTEDLGGVPEVTIHWGNVYILRSVFRSRKMNKDDFMKSASEHADSHGTRFKMRTEDGHWVYLRMVESGEVEFSSLVEADFGEKAAEGGFCTSAAEIIAKRCTEIENKFFSLASHAGNE